MQEKSTERETGKKSNGKTIYVTEEQLRKGIIFGPRDNNINIVIVDYDKNISK